MPWTSSQGTPVTCLGHNPCGANPAETKQKIDLYQSAYAHIMGRATYEAMAEALPTADHPFSPVMNAARKVVL